MSYADACQFQLDEYVVPHTMMEQEVVSEGIYGTEGNDPLPNQHDIRALIDPLLPKIILAVLHSVAFMSQTDITDTNKHPSIISSIIQDLTASFGVSQS